MRLSSIIWTLIFTAILSLPISIGFKFSLYSGIILFVTLFVFLTILFQICVNMAYNRWFYEFTESQLKIERGIIWKKYSNIPYKRIQNVDITRGIFARLFGYSNVWIQTAGYGYMGITEGYIPAVSAKEAEEIREFIIQKTDKKIQAGL